MQPFLEIWPKIAKNPVIKGGGDLSRNMGPKKIGLKKGGRGILVGGWGLSLI